MLETKRAKLSGLVSALGAVAGMGGYVGHFYSSATATFLMMAIFIVGFAAIRFLPGE